MVSGSTWLPSTLLKTSDPDRDYSVGVLGSLPIYKVRPPSLRATGKQSVPEKPPLSKEALISFGKPQMNIYSELLDGKMRSVYCETDSLHV
jgi:hypothetical protein